MEENNKKENIFTKKEIWISGVIGIIIGVILLYLLQLIPAIGNRVGTAGKVIVKSKAGTVTQNNIYEEMKKSFPISYVLELTDKSILEKKYKLTEKQEKEIKDNVDQILEQYEVYGYSEDEFFAENGFKDKEDFIEYMKLDYRRDLYCTDYFKTLIPKEDIESYYASNDIFGNINTKHILVQTSDSVTDDKALATANEIISQLNNGKNFDDVANEYKDRTISEDINFDSFEATSFASAYVEASKKLNVGEYTKEPVKTDYGYHIIYCISKEEKPTLEQVEDKIVKILGADLEADDQYIRYKALIKLREENNLKFIDSKFKKDYEEYCKKING